MIIKNLTSDNFGNSLYKKILYLDKSYKKSVGVKRFLETGLIPQDRAILEKIFYMTVLQVARHLCLAYESDSVEIYHNFGSGSRQRMILPFNEKFRSSLFIETMEFQGAESFSVQRVNATNVSEDLTFQTFDKGEFLSYNGLKLVYCPQEIIDIQLLTQSPLENYNGQGYLKCLSVRYNDINSDIINQFSETFIKPVIATF